LRQVIATLGENKMQAEKIVADEDVAKVVEAIFTIGTPVVHESYSGFGSETL
jgi:hypothetical protein